jgi:heme exporter protein B
MIRQIKYLMLKDIQLELKQRYALNGILLYVISTIFICYLSFTKIIDASTWNALFWIIMLFASLNAVSKSFVQESKARQLYYYTIAGPQAVILSKIFYNLILMVVLSLLCWAFYSVLIGDLVLNKPVFALALLLGSCGFSSLHTMIAAIASKTNNNFSLMAILSFPIVLPLLLTLIKVSKAAIEGASIYEVGIYLLVLFLINIIIVLLSYILFPYLWKE